MVTRDDVSKLAGVSKTTVSRVLNKNGYVSEENRKKIEEAIKELGYSPNLIARSLKTRESKQILFYVHEILNPFFMEVYRGMEDCCEESGYTVVLSRNFDPHKIRQRQYDGIILSHVSAENEKEYLKLGIPAVVTDYSGKPLQIPSVGINIKAGAEEAARYLLDNGHRKIAFITRSKDLEDQRFSGFCSSLEKAGIDTKTAMIGYAAQKDNGLASGYNAAKQLINNAGVFTAVFAFNDTMAIGALSAFQEKAIRVPQAVSVIGFDDILQAGFSTPKLTTVRLPKYEQGYESARLLINMMQGKTADSLVLGTELIIRDSVNKVFPGKAT
ncbi:MAG: purR [Eubacterium sp.]|nr:purR [Eubacterium sp.]